MKKFIATTFAFLVCIPCVSHSMGDKGDEKMTAVKQKSALPIPKNLKLADGKFVGTDKKRDVALFQEPSSDPLSTRLLNILESWGLRNLSKLTKGK